MITGILKYVKGGLFSGLNNFIEYDVLTDTVFHRDFGFTESEVEDLVSQVLFNIESDQKTEFMEKLKRWYNGYIINGVTLYNPWSIMNCLFKVKSDSNIDPIQAYWINTASKILLQSLFDKLKKLNLYNELVKKKSMSFTPTEFEASKFGSEEEIFWTIALHAGYLTPVIGEKDTFRVPNFEIQRYFITNIIGQWMQNSFSNNVASSLIDTYNRCLHDMNFFQAFINKALLPNLDPGKHNEYDFHILIGGMALLASISNTADYSVFSEVYTCDNKRLDNIFYPLKGTNVIIHEYKQIGYELPNDEAMEDAFWQIFANLYISNPLELYDRQEFLSKYYSNSLNELINKVG